MRRNALYKLGALAAIIVLLFLSSRQQQELDRMRNDMGINDTEDIKDKSPSVVFTTVALGSFRGFIANLLFLRSQRMQDERRYYEVHQLAKWIRNLQPKFTGAISFMAWNMSYNISVTFDTPEERWVWVRKGLDMYLDALKNHSGDPKLYWEFGWLFQHKMGMNLDDANRYYKQQWALLMVKLLSADPELVKLSTITRNPGILHGKLSRMEFHEFQKLLTALNMSYQDLADHVMNDENNELPEKFAKYLKNEEWQKEIVKFILQCERFRYEPETLSYLLEGVVDLEQIIKESGEEWDFDVFEKTFRELGRVPNALKDRIVLDSKSKAQVVEIIDSFMRDRWAWQVYRLDTRRMQAIIDEYGELDFRVAETHAIYWAKVGLEKDPDHVQCRRMVTQAMKDVVDRGKLLYFSSDTHQSIDWTYNIGMIPKAIEVLEREIEMLPEKKRSTFITGYENFLKDAVVAYYVNNNKKKAQEIYDKLRKRQPNNSAYKKPLEYYVTPELNEDLDSMNEDQARQAIDGFLNTSFQMFLYGAEEQAVFYWTRARQMNISYIKRTKNRKGRMGVQPFPVMAKRWKDIYMQNFPVQAKAIANFHDKMIGPVPSLLKRPGN